MSVVDRDYGERRPTEEELATGMCWWCRETEALPDDTLCRDCAAEFDGVEEDEE